MHKFTHAVSTMPAWPRRTRQNAMTSEESGSGSPSPPWSPVQQGLRTTGRLSVRVNGAWQTIDDEYIPTNWEMHQLQQQARAPEAGRNWQQPRSTNTVTSSTLSVIHLNERQHMIDHAYVAQSPPSLLNEWNRRLAAVSRMKELHRVEQLNSAGQSESAPEADGGNKEDVDDDNFAVEGNFMLNEEFNRFQEEIDEDNRDKDADEFAKDILYQILDKSMDD